MKRIQWIIVGYAVASFALLLFSYTQVDLNLTLSRSSTIQTLEKAFQYIGYYQRPLSTLMYVGILTLLFTLYSLLLSAVKKNVLGVRDIWRIIIVVVGIIVFSYPAAFSYDFFNYMFTAKTVLVYHQNPYIVTPLAFAGIDPWTNFMRWTHLTTAYAPLWIVMTFVPYVLGLGYFILILFNIKFMVAGFYLLTAWVLTRCVDEIDPKHTALSLAIFALNPLMLIESLVSGHNDVVLTAFALLAVLAYLKKDLWSAWMWLSVSIAAKLVTMVFIPVMLLRKKGVWFAGAMMGSVAIVLLKREFLPWYWVWVMPFIALLPAKLKLWRFAAIVSLGLAVSYAPFVYFGEYSQVEQMWKTSIIWIGVGIGLLSFTVKSTRTQ